MLGNVFFIASQIAVVAAIALFLKYVGTGQGRRKRATGIALILLALLNVAVIWRYDVDPLQFAIRCLKGHCPSPAVQGNEPFKRQASAPKNLPEIEVPEISELPEIPKSTAFESMYSVAGVSLGMKLDEAVRTITERDGTCGKIAVQDKSWSGITVTTGSKDPVFQSPTVMECYESARKFEHIYLFPDIYESNSRVFAVARVSTLSDLRPKDIRDLLEHRYGFAAEPSYQPNYGSHLHWVQGRMASSEPRVKGNKNCFLYLPRALKSSLTDSPVRTGARDVPRAQLNSHELKGDCGAVLSAFVSKNGPLWLFLANTTRVQAYKKYASHKAAAAEAERINKARSTTKF